MTMKKPKWKRMGLFFLAAVFLFAAGCGQVAEQPAGSIPDPGPSHSTEADPPTQLPESTPTPEPEYDVFSDPNVLWGSGQDFRRDLLVMPKGTVEISGELSELLTQAAGSNLIAFRLRITERWLDLEKLTGMKLSFTKNWTKTVN